MPSTTPLGSGSTKCRSRPRRCSKHCVESRKARPDATVRSISPTLRGLTPRASPHPGKEGTGRLCRSPRSERLSGTLSPGGTVPVLSLRFVILLISMLAAPTTLTIVETGRIAGHVRDPQGTPVKHARVVVVGTALTAATDDSGAYL